MSVPADLTATTIVTEAFNRAGKASPSAGELTRAQTYFLMEVINEIWTRPQVHDSDRQATPASKRSNAPRSNR